MRRSDLYFSNKDSLKDLGRRTVRGGAINIATQGTRLAIHICSIAVLARLLTPDDFGLVGMVTVLMQLAVFFRDFGLTQATIQRPEITRQQISNLFWFNTLISILLVVPAIACAPLIVRFYGQPELAPIVWVLATGVLIEALGLQHRALMVRSLQFPRLAVAEIGSNLFSVSIAIYMAWNGYGYWALVGQIVCGSLFRTTFYFMVSGWCPQLPRRRAGTKPFITYGSNLFGFNILNYFSRNADNILIGKYIGADALGYYNNAYRLLMLPLQQISGPLSQAIIPMLSRLQHDPEQYRLNYYRCLGIVQFITFLPVGLLVATAEPLILVMLGPDWAGAVPIFIMLLPAAYISAMNIATAWLFITLGTTNRQFKWTLFAAPFTVLCMIAGLPYGAIGVAAGTSFAYVVIRVPYMLYAYKGTPIRFRDIIRIVAYPLLLSLGLGIAVKIILVHFFADASNLMQLITGCAIYGIAYISTDVTFLRSNSITVQGVQFFLKRKRP